MAPCVLDFGFDRFIIIRPKGQGYHTSMTPGDLLHAEKICRPPESNVVHNKVKKNMVYKSTQGEGVQVYYPCVQLP